MSLDHGKNFADRPGMQPRRLVNVDMVDTRVTAHVNISERAMKARGLSRNRLAKEMGTSRSQISRLLDPSDGNVTLLTLQRAAEMLGRKVRLELV